MASTYSTDLKLELMATGENAGTWGTKTNTNLNLIQQAIAGFQSIDVASADVTLVMTDASISNARNMVLKFTGTLSANRQVLLPDSIEKFYIVQDATTHGAYTLTFKTVSGTGFELSAGKISAAFSDGTNVTEIALNTLSGTIATSQLTGTISTAQIADDAITTVKIADDQITTAKILDSQITGAKILTTTDVRIDSLGVGTAASGTTGEIRATNDVTSFYSSDISLKENIINIPNPLEIIKKLNGVLFDWKKSYIDKRGGEDGYFVRKRDVGVIAQEVEKVLPEAVAQRADGIKAVKYDRLTCLLIEAVKQLQDKVDSLTKKGS
jgi:hypothetical protein